MNAIEVQRISKQFRSRKRKAKQNKTNFLGVFRRASWKTVAALDEISFSIRKGEFFALLGPNGAGKTTLIRILSTTVEPDRGETFVNGYSTIREADKVRASIGVVLGGERSVYWKLTGRENLEYFSRLYHVPPDIARERIEELITIVQLNDNADTYVENYSSGMRHRLKLAKGLLHDPPILLLDEPTLGLDPKSARHIRKLLRTLQQEKGKTILLTTHYMEEADQLAETIGIVDQGKIIALDQSSNLKNNLRTSTTQYQSSKPTLEDVFLHLTGRALTENEIPSPLEGEG